MSIEERYLKEKIKKSKLVAADFFEYKKLELQDVNFIPCVLAVEKEELCFSFDMLGLKPFESIHSEELENKYQFLVNFARLERIIKNYKISFNPENIYYDENFIPQIKYRDVYEVGELPLTKDHFLEMLKCYVGGILQKKYSVTDLLDGGYELLSKNKALLSVHEAMDVETIVMFLRTKKQNRIVQRKDEELHINKKKYVFRRMVSRFIIAVLLVAVVFTSYYTVVLGPRMEAVIEANQAYLNKDYVGCIDALKKLDLKTLDKDSKYILAVSYTQGESFKKEDLDSILSRLSPGSNEKEFDYWIHIGRQEMDEAQDIAVSISDDKLLIYAYMKEHSMVQANTQISGQEKKTRLDQLEAAIKALGDKYQNQQFDVDVTQQQEPEVTEIEQGAE